MLHEILEEEAPGSIPIPGENEDQSIHTYKSVHMYSATNMDPAFTI